MHKLKCVWLFCLLSFVLKIQSQISITPTSGCAPLSCTLSGPAGASNVLWNLGGTMGTSTLITVNPLYSTPGTYNITYTAMVSGSPVSYNGQIVVSAGPGASYSFIQPGSHCAPCTVTLTGTSTFNGSFSWYFGDISSVVTGTSSTVTHTYAFQGSFMPLVVFTDATTGCTVAAAPAGNGTIHVSTPPVPNIQSSNGFVGCAPPFTANITGSNSVGGSPIGGGSLSYNWTFNGGTPGNATGASPGPVVFGNGIQTLSLQVTDNNQC